MLFDLEFSLSVLSFGFLSFIHVGLSMCCCNEFVSIDLFCVSEIRELFMFVSSVVLAASKLSLCEVRHFVCGIVIVVICVWWC